LKVSIRASKIGKGGKDNDKNLNSEVQFVMQTEEIKIDKPETVKAQVNPDDNLTFFQRILRWFKK